MAVEGFQARKVVEGGGVLLLLLLLGLRGRVLLGVLLGQVKGVRRRPPPPSSSVMGALRRERGRGRGVGRGHSALPLPHALAVAPQHIQQVALVVLFPQQLCSLPDALL